MERAYDIEDLKRLMERLRDPAYGCPWDLKQTYQSIAPFTLEEMSGAYRCARAVGL